MAHSLVQVSPASARNETIGALAAALVVLALVGLRVWQLRLVDEPYYIRPYQRLDSVLTEDERTLYQSLNASVPDVTAFREALGSWPEAVLLEAEAVPPFDALFMPRALRGYIWNSHDGGSWVDYIGQDPAREDGRAFILRVIDLHALYHPHPHPGVDYDPEMRHAVQVWAYPQPDREYPGERLPEAGWLWIVRPDDFTLQVKEEDVWTPTPVGTPGTP